MKFDFYVVMSVYKDAQGLPISGSYRGFDWFNGVITQPFSKFEARRIAGVVGGTVAEFLTISEEEVKDWIRKYTKVPEPAPRIEDISYQKMTSEMAKAEFHWTEFTDGDRSKEAVTAAFRHCVENNIVKCEVQL